MSAVTRSRSFFVSARQRRDNRARRDELLANRIDLQVQPFEGMRAEQRHVSRFGEHDEIGCLRARGPHERIADVAINAASVSDDEALLSARHDTKCDEHVTRHPGVLASRIDEHVRQDVNAIGLLETPNLDGRAEDAHFSHDSTLP